MDNKINGSTDNIVVDMRHISKSFPGIKANDDISLTLKKGEIHALLGENGAGKSTLMSILFGLIEPDEGEIYINGQEAKIRNPNDATALGIGMVHQHFKLVECYTALQNIILGFEPTKFGFLKPKAVRQSIIDLCNKYHFKVNIDEKIENMPVGEQQKVEILKMLYRQNDILIFDEPTAVLTPQEIDDLMISMKELVSEGKSILFISHKLNEIMKVSDRVTILSKGRYLGTYNTKETTPEVLSRLMVGRDVQLVVQKREPKIGKEVLTVKDLHVINEDNKLEVVKGVSFNVRQGEIVCLAGIEGNGQSDFIYALTGLEKVKSGELILHDVDRLKYQKQKEDYFQEHNTGKAKRFKSAVHNICNKVKYGLSFISYGCKEAYEAVKVFFSNVFSFLGYWLKTFFINMIGNPIKNAFRKLICLISKKEFVPSPKNVYEKPIWRKKNKINNPKEERELPEIVDVHLENLTIRQRNLAGLAHIPEDRQRYGLVLDFNLRDNLVLEKYFEPGFQSHGFINNKEREKYAQNLIEKYDIRSGKGTASVVRNMSGGNQQKAILARELDRDASLVVAVQPTRGLDVGAIENIHKQIIKGRDEGKAILLVSLELEEVMNLSDRILVMYNGEIVAELDPKKTSAEEIGLYMSGSQRMDLNKEEPRHE